MRELLSSVEATVEERSARRVVMLVDEQSSLLPRWLCRRWPKLFVVCLTPTDAIRTRVADGAGNRLAVETARSISYQHSVLSAFGPFDVVVDAASHSEQDQLEAIKAVFLHLRRSGVYLAAGQGRRHQADSVLDSYLSGQTEADRSSNDHGLPVGVIEEAGRTRWVRSFTSRVATSPKLRYYELDEVLRLRPSMGRLITRRPGCTYRSKAQVSMNTDAAPFPLADEIKVPPLGIREYQNVLCSPHQVLTHKGVLLTDSYRHYLNRTLTSRYVDDLAERFARRRKSSTDAVLPGHHFYLGSEFPQHFGHVMTEQLSRLWAWPEVKRAHPDAKALVEVRSRHEGLMPWEIAIFGAAGVAEEDLVAVKGEIRVETLIAAAPMLVNPHYAHPELAELWARTGDALAVDMPDSDRHDKIFVSRHDAHGKRACRNTREIEKFFTARGFQVVYPEDHPIGEQVSLFREARTIAGLAGSGLFHLCFCEPKRVIIIWPESYSARNEYLISSVIGHELTVFWCTPDRGHPEDGWDVTAYQSTYAFDFERDGERLADVLATD